MARKTAVFVVEDEGRDRGKQFLLTEMAPIDTERWAMRAFMALARANIDIGPDAMAGGMAGFARLGLSSLAKADYRDVEPLLAEMLNCVEYQYEPRKPQLRRKLDVDAGDIEEVVTLMKLRMEVFKLHANFLTPAG
jgi:hypothetical protein